MPQENSAVPDSAAIVHVTSGKIASAENGAGFFKARSLNPLEKLGYIARHAIPDALEALPVVGPALRYGREQEGRGNLYAGIGQGFDRLGRKSANIVQDSAEVALSGVGATAAANYLKTQRLQSGDTRNTDNRVQDGVEATARFGAAALRSAGRILKGVVIGSLALASLPIVVPVAAAAATAYGTVKLGTLAFNTLKEGAIALATGTTELARNTQEQWQDYQKTRAMKALKQQVEAAKKQGEAAEAALAKDRQKAAAASQRITEARQAIIDVCQQDISASFDKMLGKPTDEQDKIWSTLKEKIDTPEEMQALLSVITQNPAYEDLYNQIDARNPPGLTQRRPAF